MDGRALIDYGFPSTKPVSISMNPRVQLNEVDGEPLEDESQYRRLIGRLICLTISKHDITYVVNRLSQFMTKPRTIHLQIAQYFLLQHLKGTAGQDPHYKKKRALVREYYVAKRPNSVAYEHF